MSMGSDQQPATWQHPCPGCVVQQERELLVQHLTKAEGHLAGGRLSITYPRGLLEVHYRRGCQGFHNSPSSGSSSSNMQHVIRFPPLGKIRRRPTNQDGTCPPPDDGSRRWIERIPDPKRRRSFSADDDLGWREVPKSRALSKQE